jgi:cell division protein FtsA
MEKKKLKVIASLDIGSSKIVCMIAYINHDGSLNIRSIAHQKSSGISNGRIVNKKEAVKTILSTISLAEKTINFNIDNICINISDSKLESSTVNAKLKIANREIKERDIYLLFKDIISSLRKSGKEVIHLLPLQYLVDDNIVDSPYIIANNLSVTLNLIAIQKNPIEIIKDSIKSMMLNIDSYVTDGYANFLSVPNTNELEFGAVIFDIGADNTNIGLLYDNKFIFETNIGMAGNAITNDISNILKVNFEIAEKIKNLNANFNLTSEEEKEFIRIKIDEDTFEASKNNIKLINDIVKSRIEEIIEIGFDVLKKNNLHNVPKYIILTGGTSAILGIDSFIEKITNKETRINYNNNFNVSFNSSYSKEELKNSFYSVSMGMLKFMQHKYTNYGDKDNDNGSAFLNFIKKFLS